MADPDYLDTPLIQFGKMNWTVRNAVEGVQIFGGIGSGKTSGSGRMLALKYLKAGFGGLVLTAKPDEIEHWIKYCIATSRRKDLIIVEPGKKHSFNFFDYEIEKSPDKQAITENIVEVLKTVLNASEAKEGGHCDDPFWEKALDMLIFNVIDLCRLAYQKISVQQMYDIVQTLPKAGVVHDKEQKKTAFEEAFELAMKNVNQQFNEWSFTQKPEYLEKLKEEGRHEQVFLKEVHDGRIFKFVDEFFNGNFQNLAERTRSIIEFSFSGFLFRLLRNPVYDLFCSRVSTFSPEKCLKGKIILINLPVKLHHKIGRDSQIMFKYIWQRAMEKRKIKPDTKPIFLWADEAQHFLHEHDAEYQATARSSRLATVYITQNLPNYYANMGGRKGDHHVKSFLGTLATKIFHANADIETNNYASELIGDDFRLDIGSSVTMAGQFSSSKSKSLKSDKEVHPEEFSQLKTGGGLNNFKVEAYIHFQGETSLTNNYLKTRFDQKFKP